MVGWFVCCLAGLLATHKNKQMLGEGVQFSFDVSWSCWCRRELRHVGYLVRHMTDIFKAVPVYDLLYVVWIAASNVRSQVGFNTIVRFGVVF